MILTPNLANLLHPGFQGVRWTRDQPMPGSFPAPPTFKGKALGTRLLSSTRQLFLISSVRLENTRSLNWFIFLKN